MTLASIIKLNGAKNMYYMYKYVYAKMNKINTVLHKELTHAHIRLRN